MDNLPVFLRKIASDIEEKKISDNDLTLVSEFYIKILFDAESKNLDKEELLKYTTLGWYIYNFILQKN